ncbi:WSC domain-containing protein [Rhizophagus clarus]|uniref:WSC domain-containing protein n=1 Tax=Rhizophagus clarus TaxID=94130 RepID=A0A8H3LEU9_9GLOM|nr:WSC domain-containing protein [Rhizophagus clarus]
MANNEICVDKCGGNGEILIQDPQVTPLGCFIRNYTVNDSFNGLDTLNSPSRPSLVFPDPYTNQNSRIIGYCIKHCIDLKFNYSAIENGSNCRCGYANALQSYIQVDDNTCNLSCTMNTLTGTVTYPCGGKGAYTVYKAEIQYYTSPYNVTIEEKLDIMYNVDKNPYYKGCIQDEKFCGKRILSSSCSSAESMTVDTCIDNCRKGNYKYAGLEARAQCFCGNSYDSVGRLLDSGYCSASCPGNNFQICGGIWALSLYEVPPTSGSSCPGPPCPDPPCPDPKALLIIGLSIGISALVIGTILLIRRYSKHYDEYKNAQ